jgi:hypothetical protein
MMAGPALAGALIGASGLGATYAGGCRQLCSPVGHVLPSVMFARISSSPLICGAERASAASLFEGSGFFGGRW